jgi:NHL repeat-containing protein
MRRIATALCAAGLLIALSTPGSASAAFGPVSSFGGVGSSQISHPQGVAVDSTGHVYVVDAGNNRVEKFAGDGGFLSTLSATGDFQPQDVAVSGGSVYVSSLNRVDIWNSLSVHSSFVPSGLGSGYGIAVDSSGNIYVSDFLNSQIREYNGLGIFVKAIGSEGSGTGQMEHPRGLAIDGSNTLYVADPSNGRVDKFATSGASLGDIPMPTYTVNTSGGTFSGRVNPQDVDVDGTGRVFVPDSGVHSNLVAVLGANSSVQQEFGAPDSDPANVCKVSSPWGLAISSSGTLYVASTGENLVRIFNETSSPCPSPNFTQPGGGGGGGGNGGGGGAAGATGNGLPQISFTGFPTRHCVKRNFVFQIHLYDADRIAKMEIFVNGHRVARQTPDEQFWNVKVRMPVRALRQAIPPGRSIKIGIMVRVTDSAGGSATASRAFRVCH